MSLSNNLAKTRGLGKLAKIGVTQTGKAICNKAFWPFLFNPIQTVE